jgi:hypothetical protein
MVKTPIPGDVIIVRVFYPFPPEAYFPGFDL